MISDLGEHTIERAVSGRFGTPVRYFDTVGSTNSVALEWAAAGAPEGAVVAADHQTGGRGRRGRMWWSEPRRALLFSLVVRPDVLPDRLGLITTVLGVACAEGVASCAGVAVRLKWPNDLIVGGRKLGGILVETKLRSGRVEAAVAGVGINVAWPRDEMPPDIAGTATSVAAERAVLGLDGGPSRTDLLVAVLESAERWYPALGDDTAGDELVARATALSDVLGRRVTVRVPAGRTIDGVAGRLTSSGGLQVETHSGPVDVDAGEIERVRFA